MSPWVVVGDPGNRRVSLFQEAAHRLDVPVDVVSWHAVLDDVAVLDRPGRRVLRLESMGEDDRLADRLRSRGADRVRGRRCEWTERAGRPGELLAPRQTHEGFLSVLDTLERWSAEHPDVVLQQPLATIRTCFDKAVCQRRLEQAGVPVPIRVEASTVDDLIEAARTGPIFVKLTCGSSASGLALLRTGGRVLMTTIRSVDGARYNAFRVQRQVGADLRGTLQWLLDEGTHVERAVRRPRLEGAFFDVRVLVIDGEPRFAIPRCARHPITNLHLGGWRGSLRALRDRMGADAWARLRDVCREVARVLPAGHLGVDVAIRSGFDQAVVLEVNAFGDLLPGLTMDGLDPYGVQIVSRLPKHGGRVLHYA